MVVTELTGEIGLTSSHLEYTSITSRNVWPSKGQQNLHVDAPTMHLETPTLEVVPLQGCV